MLGVQAAFVRRLDAEQLVEPARSDGGHRRYTRNQILQVQRVSDMAGEGLTLAGIRRILVLEAEVAELQRQLAELRAATTERAADTTP
jgi:MerR family transcriptional regulator/heat shock protein HspR